MLFNKNISFFINDLQFTNYHLIDYNLIVPFIQKYFIVSDEINEIVMNIEKKYNINYNNTCCIFYRGNDKVTETVIPCYDEIYNNIKKKIKNKENIRFLLQSDETEFFTFFKNKLNNFVIFENEIKHINKQNTSINHITDLNTKLALVKNFLAIVIVMSKCKYIVCTSGNISLWISYFRGNADNIYQYLINEWKE